MVLLVDQNVMGVDAHLRREGPFTPREEPFILTLIRSLTQLVAEHGDTDTMT